MSNIPHEFIERGFMTLFVNHKRYWRARFPNEDPVNYTVWGGKKVHYEYEVNKSLTVA
jgi:hypothetical protein